MGHRLRQRRVGVAARSGLWHEGDIDRSGKEHARVGYHQMVWEFCYHDALAKPVVLMGDGVVDGLAEHPRIVL